MQFDIKRLEANDPEYKPGLSWSGKYAKWKAPKKYAQAGYEPKWVKLKPGQVGDIYDDERGAICREQTRHLIAWWENQSKGPKEGTWEWLIYRYTNDEFSPLQAVKGNTREGYLPLLGRWNGIIGSTMVRDLKYEDAMIIKKAMKEKGRTDSNIRRMFTMLRTIASYAVLIGTPGADKVRLTLSIMKFPAAPRRNVSPTRQQIRMIIDEADRKGMFAFATGIMMQYEFSLRAVDVRGQWIKAPEGSGGIYRSGRVWQDGLTWDMFDRDLKYFDKVISKTARSMPEPYRFDLTNVPEVMARLGKMREASPAGPVIISEAHGLPYERCSWGRAFSGIRDHLGLPKEIKMMDTRSGGATEASSLGVDPMALRDALQHSSVTTTDRYVRGRSDRANKVVQIRQDNEGR